MDKDLVLTVTMQDREIIIRGATEELIRQLVAPSWGRSDRVYLEVGVNCLSIIVIPGKHTGRVTQGWVRTDFIQGVRLSAPTSSAQR